MARHREVLESDELAAVCPIFRDAERVIADPVVRNRGTVGGSLCQADPAEDLTTVCAVLDAVCVARGPVGRARDPDRRLPRRPLRDVAGAQRDADRGPDPVAARTAPAPTRRWSGGSATGRSTAAGAAVTLDGDTIAAARLGLTAVNADAAALAAVADALVGQPPPRSVFAEAGRRAAAGLRAGHRHARQRGVQAAPRRRTDRPNVAHAAADACAMPPADRKDIDPCR